MNDYINQIESIVNSMTGGITFLHETVQMHNVQADAQTTVYARAIALGVGAGTVLPHGISPRPKIAIEFVQQVEFEDSMQNNQPVFDAMFQHVIEFIQRYNNSGVFEKMKDFEFEYVYERFAANLAGVALMFDCQLKKVYTNCSPSTSPQL